MGKMEGCASERINQSFMGYISIVNSSREYKFWRKTRSGLLSTLRKEAKRGKSI